MKSFAIATCLSLLSFLAAPLQAGMISFQPDPRDLDDLPHQYYFTWGLRMDQDVSLLHVQEAQLRFKSIRNWDNGPNRLYVHLLDWAPEGVRSYWDNEGGGDNFAGEGIELVTYTNLPSQPQDLVYSFTPDEVATLNDYIQNGADVALGIDPDCHFWNRGVSLDMCYQVVPEPACIALMALGTTLGIGKRFRRP